MRPTLTELMLIGALGSCRNYGLPLADSLGLQRPMTYTALGQMVHKGWVTAHPEQIDESSAGRRARTYYEVTPAGRAVFVQVMALLTALDQR